MNLNVHTFSPLALVQWLRLVYKSVFCGKFVCCFLCVEVNIVFLWSETHIHFNICKRDYWLFLCTFREFLSTHNPRDWVLLLEDWCLFNNLIHKTRNKKKDRWHHCFGWNTSLKYESQSHQFFCWREIKNIWTQIQEQDKQINKNKPHLQNQFLDNIHTLSCQVVDGNHCKIIVTNDLFLEWFSISKQLIKSVWYLDVIFYWSNLIWFCIFSSGMLLFCCLIVEQRNNKKKWRKKNAWQKEKIQTTMSSKNNHRIVTGMNVDTWNPLTQSFCFSGLVIQELPHVKCHKHNTALGKQNFICCVIRILTWKLSVLTLLFCQFLLSVEFVWFVFIPPVSIKVKILSRCFWSPWYVLSKDLNRA